MLVFTISASKPVTVHVNYSLKFFEPKFSLAISKSEAVVNLITSVSTTIVKKKLSNFFFFRIAVHVSNGKELKTSPFIVSYLLPEKGIKAFRFSVTSW